MALFDDLIKKSSEFVEKQKGIWDHTAWTNFISDSQKKGVKLTEDMQNYLGTVLESMKKFYSTSTIGKDVSDNIGSSAEKIMSVVSEQTSKYIQKTKGVWDHSGWENFLKDIQNKGVELTEETKSFIGDMLESVKKFYTSIPLTATKEAPKAKSTLTTKKTTKTKAATTTKESPEVKSTQTTKAAPKTKTVSSTKKATTSMAIKK